MNRMSFFLLYFAVAIGVFPRARPVFASESNETLNKLKEISETNSNEPIYVLDPTEPSEPKEYSKVQILDKTYYFKPETNSLAQILSGTPAGNLITANEEEANFELDGVYYRFDINAIPKSSYKIVSATQNDYNFVVKKADNTGLLSNAFYKISFKDEQGKNIFENTQNILWQEVFSKDANTIEIQLPHNTQETNIDQDLRYYKYTYSPVATETTIKNRTPVPELLNQDGNIINSFVQNYVLSSSSALGGAIYNYNSQIGGITGSFIENYAASTSSNAYGGAIYNNNDSSIANLTGSFIKNYVSSSNGTTQGGVIYNYSTSKIGNITGDFIENHAFGNITYAGALFNHSYSTIGDITGDFIGNYGIASSYAYAGALLNHSHSTIGNISGDFIGNYVSATNASAYGGVIYNYTYSTIGDITGDFIGNYASSTNSSAYSGVIFNHSYSSIGNITGDFIGNYVIGLSFAQGGTIFNHTNSTIGNITGDFIGNYINSTNSSTSGGIIYNNSDSIIGNITGNFIGNYAASYSSSTGGAIANHNNSQIGDILGNFIGNYATGTNTSGGAIYNNNNSAISSLKSDFVGNYVASSSSSGGGAILNQSSSTIGDIIGSFTQNYATGTFSAYGGAINNNTYAKIGNISGDFIENYTQSDGYVYSGAIHNSTNAIISNISGNFIKNHSISTNSTVKGGAIYNYNSQIGGITGSFIGNYATSYSSSIGGAIANHSNSTIGYIFGSFIENYATSSTSNIQGGAIYNSNTSTIGNITGDFIGNYASAETGTYSQGGAIFNYLNSIVGNISGSFIKNYAKSKGSSAKGGAIHNYSASEIGDIVGDFVGNYASTETGPYTQGGAIFNYTDSKIGNITGDFIGNYTKSASSISSGGAIFNQTNASIGNITGDFIDNYAFSGSNEALGGAIYLNQADINLTTTALKRNILIENNQTIIFGGSDKELRKLNSINFASTDATVNLMTIPNSYINLRDPMTSINFSSSSNTFGIVNKTGAGSVYLWGDNREFDGSINIKEGNFYAMFDQADKWEQRHNFSIENATLNFSNGTTFRPMMNEAKNKLATLNLNKTTIPLGGGVTIVPYNISSLNTGTYNFENNYYGFKGWENELAKIDTSSTEKVVFVLKKDLFGYEDLSVLADIYRKRSDLSLQEREVFDNIYYTGKVSKNIKEQFNVIEGQDKIAYATVHKSGVRQFSRQISSRIQNKNCPSCGMENGFSDEHFWFNVGQNFVEKDAKGLSMGYEYNPTSLAIGYDHDLIPNALNVGVAFSYAYGEIKGKEETVHNTSDVDEYLLSLYWKYKPARAYSTGSLGGGMVRNKTRLLGLTVDTRGDYETKVAFSNFEFGYDFGNTCGVIEPFIGIEYAYIYSDAYSEKGIGARHFDTSIYNSIELPIGLRVSRNFMVDSYIITPAVELAYARSFGDRNSEVNSYFVGNTNNPWTLKGSTENRDSLRSGLNLKINNYESRFAFNLGYARDTQSGYSDDQLYLTIRYNF